MCNSVQVTIQLSYVTQTGLKQASTLLLQLPEYWDYRSSAGYPGALNTSTVTFVVAVLFCLSIQCFYV